MSLTTLDTSFKWNDAVLSCLTGLFHLAQCLQVPQLVVYDRISFLYGYHIYHIFFIDGHLGYFYFLAIVNSTTMNMVVQMSLTNPDFNPFG